MSSEEKNDWSKGFATLVAKTHREQAKWFLNGFWNDGAEDNAEEVWKITHHFVELDCGQKILYGKKKQNLDEGCDLDEVKSHRILEILGETMTVLALRKRLDALDIDNNKRMSLSEYLLDKYDKKPDKLVNAPQGTIDEKELEEAEEKVSQAQILLDEALTAKKECEKLEAPLKKANEDLQAVVDEIQEIEKKRADKIKKLDGKINNKKNSTVTIGRAKSEKEQLLSEDPLPLRKAKITQKAQLKKVKKARKPFKIATDNAKEKHEDAEKAFKEAEDFLNELKNRGGTPHGSIWWMSRELEEKKKFMP